MFRIKEILLSNREILTKSASYSRFWLIWQCIRRQIWCTKRWVTWRQMGTLKSAGKPFHWHHQQLILGTIHSKVLNGFSSDEGWAALCAHTAFRLNLGWLTSDEWQLQGAFHHVCVQDTHVEPVMSQIQRHNRQVCSPVSSYRCILSAEVILAQSSLSFPTGQNSASKKGFVCFPMHFQLK